MATRRLLVLSWMGMLMVGLPAWVCAQFPAPEASPEHKVLLKDVGVWDADMKLWVEGPDSEPLVSKGVERSRPLGGMWVISDYEGELGGEKFAGHGQMGYDPVKRKYIGTWIDTMTPFLGQMEGTYNDATHELTMEMVSIDPGTNRETKSRMVTKHVDNNTRMFTMWMEAPGVGDGWVKSMEMSYKRRQE